MNFIEDITKKINLEKNDGLSSFLNMPCQQHHETFEVFYNFLKQTQPSNIIEIGTGLGGFTGVIKRIIDELKLNCKILSYEIRSQVWYENMKNNGIDVRVENVFIGNYNDVTQYVKDFIAQWGVTIVLCDGGSKKDEFNVLSNYLKIGDFILAHDYSYDFENFEANIKNKIWNWCEIIESDIEIPCKQNNLIDYDREVFNNVAWVCKVKVC